MEIPHTKIFYVLILALTVAIGVVEYNAEDNRQVQANLDNITFLLDQYPLLIDSISERGKMLQTLEDDIIANHTALQDYDEIITTQIGNLRSDIKNKFPQAADVDKQGQSSGAGTPFLTLKMDTSEFFLGNIVIFTGMANPNDPIFLTLKSPDRMLTAIAISKTDIIDGSYMANYTLRLDDPIGTWQVYARQTSDQTKTLTFKVE